MAVRKCRAWITIAGQQVNVTELNCSRSRTKNADTFSARLPLYDRESGLDATYWCNTKEIKDVAVWIQAETSEGREMLKGDVEQVQVDFAQMTVYVTGRDKTSKLIDDKTTEKFLNKKSSEIVKELAERAGLEVKVSDTALKAGKLYNIDFNKLTDHASPWTYIHELADKEGFEAYVKDGVLNFVSEDESEGEISITYRPPTRQQYAQGDFVGLKVQRNLNLSKPHKVKVKSWNRKQKKVIESEKSIGGTGAEKVYSFKYEELTKDRADRLAEKHLSRNVRHEMSIQLTEMPGDETINPRMKINLSGTQTDFDQSYFIKSINDVVTQRGGYVQTFEANNKDEKRK